LFLPVATHGHIPSILVKRMKWRKNLGLPSSARTTTRVCPWLLPLRAGHAAMPTTRSRTTTRICPRTASAAHGATTPPARDLILDRCLPESPLHLRASSPTTRPPPSSIAASLSRCCTSERYLQAPREPIPHSRLAGTPADLRTDPRIAASKIDLVASCPAPPSEIVAACPPPPSRTVAA
jgi:hypothetical protein